jgi:hypothetical protein
MADLGTRLALNNYLFSDTVTKDRFKSRTSPAQNDRPSEGTFQTFVDTVAINGDVSALAARVTTAEDDINTLEGEMLTKLTKAQADLLYVDIATEGTVVTHTGQIDTLNTFKNTTVPATYKTIVAADNDYAPKIDTQNALTDLDLTKLEESTFNTYRDTVVNPRLNVEHFTWNPTGAGSTYLISFLPNTKVNISSLVFKNIPNWTIFAMNGNATENAPTIQASTNSATNIENFNTGVNVDVNINGILMVVHSVQTVVSGTYNIPPSVSMRLEYLY